MFSVVSTCVNLNKTSKHMKNWKIKNQPVHWFGFTASDRAKLNNGNNLSQE